MNKQQKRKGRKEYILARKKFVTYNKHFEVTTIINIKSN